MSVSILTCKNWKNCFLVAEKFNMPILDITQNSIDWSFEKYILIFSNRGDEELPPEMEHFLINLKIENKKYQICELGNDFGFERPFGSALIVYNILNKLKWILTTPIYSLDTVPNIDWNSLNLWISNEI